MVELNLKKSFTKKISKPNYYSVEDFNLDIKDKKNLSFSWVLQDVVNQRLFVWSLVLKISEGECSIDGTICKQRGT